MGRHIDAEEARSKKVCGAKTKHGPCQQWKGAGTDHLGTGACKNHGGATRNHSVKAETEQAIERMRTYGSPIDVEPHDALLEEVRRTAGHVAWLSGVVTELLHEGDGYSESINEDGKRVLRSRSGLKQMDTSGKFEKPSVWVEMYLEERRMLAPVCKMALDAGVAERQVRVAEAQGELLAGVIKAILGDLGLDKEQQTDAPAIVRRHLLALAG